MRLSEAIRLGAMLRPKADGYFFKDGKSCAQGAALEATGVAYVEYGMDSGLCEIHHEQVGGRWPWASVFREGNGVVRCPVCPEHRVSITSMIAHLNNSCGHGWSREAIADWLEPIETQFGERPEPMAQEADVQAEETTVR